jgi:hypothetical protein
MLGMAAAALFIGAFIGLIFLSLATYVVQNLWPPGRKLALWAARLDNFLPLLILAVVLIFLMVVIYVLLAPAPTIVKLLLVLLLFLFLVILALVGFLLELAILVYVIRLVGWLYRRWKRLFMGLWPQIMRLKIKHEVGKDKDKDWTTHFAEIRKKLSQEADVARRKISKGGQ